MCITEPAVGLGDPSAMCITAADAPERDPEQECKPPEGLGPYLLRDAPEAACGVGARDPHRRFTLVGDGGKKQTPEYGLLGRLQTSPGVSEAPDVYLNTHDPFCFVTVGVQGSGKSHSLSVVLESCVLHVADELKRATDDALRLRRPMTSLVFHYDQNQRNGCEAIGVVEPSDGLRAFVAGMQRDASAAPLDPPTLPRDKMLVLVSPSNFQERKAFYGQTYGPKVRVEPLLFSWSKLSAKQLKCLMRINEGDNQLYVSTMLSLLRGFQRQQRRPAFAAFCTQIEQTCSLSSQNGPLRQRLALLEALMQESAINQEFHGIGGDLCGMEEGMLVVADLTDPLLSPEEANGIFEVLLDQFRSDHVCGSTEGGKLLVLDEAHRYVSGADSDGLSRSIVDAVRLMRHEGLRVAISTQSPKVLAPELLELVSLMLIHRFHSQDWFQYLKSKVALPPGGFDTIRELATGQALVFAAAQSVVPFSEHSSTPLLLSVRARFTRDLGASVTNSGCPRTPCAPICNEDKGGWSEMAATCVTTPSARRLGAAAATATAAGLEKLTARAGTSKTAPEVQGAKTQGANKHEDKEQEGKVQEWLSRIVKHLKKAGGKPVALEHLANPIAGGVARPEGLAKKIKLRDVLAAHAKTRGLVLTKKSVALPSKSVALA